VVIGNAPKATLSTLDVLQVALGACVRTPRTMSVPG
jgi:hypothetical protein